MQPPSRPQLYLGCAGWAVPKAYAAISDGRQLVDEVERGEDHIRAKFETAMKDSEVSPGIMSAVTEAHTSVRNGHDQMRDIKKAMHASG